MAKPKELHDLNLKLGRKPVSAQLDAIPREIGRRRLGFQPGKLPFVGEDLWNAYEVSFLLPGGKPVVYHMQARYGAHSPAMVESKSFKLFLNTQNDRTFQNLAAFSAKVQAALGQCVGAQVQLQFYGPDGSPPPQPLTGESLDHLAPTTFAGAYDAGLLQVRKTDATAFAYHSHLLRSNCPVTGQPDWGAVRIAGKGSLQPDPPSLLAYLLSFRNHGDFHETCCETIFTDLHRLLSPEILEITCHYTRRGGLDINPSRRTPNLPGTSFRPVWRQ